MSCNQAQLALLIEYIERRIESKMKKTGLNKQTRQQIIYEIEKVK